MGDCEVDKQPVQEDIYEVQEIVGMKKVGDVWLYRVRWKDYGPQSDTWEPESNLRTVWKMVEKYKAKVNKVSVRSKRRGRPSIHSNDATAEGKDNLNTGIKTTQEQETESKKRIKSSPQEKKDTFWKDLEEGKIDVFKEDLYSRVKSRASSRNSSSENSPKLVKSEKSWSQSSNDSSDSSDTTEMDCNVKINNRKTEALLSAVRNSDVDLIKIFIENGYDINSQSEGNQETPLMVACEMNNLVVSQLLLQHGAGRDIVDRKGDTALIKACRFGFDDIIKLLLSNGANFAIVNKIGLNALRVAKLNAHKNIQDDLMNHISRLTLSFELQVMNILYNTAKIVNALFPLQCHSVCQDFLFKFEFRFDKQKPAQPGVGYLLFIANSNLFFKEANCKLSGPNTVQEVLLNGTPQKPLTDGAKFIFSFNPLLKGTNELIIRTNSNEKPKIKLLICAYEVMLVNHLPAE